jgi:hypothetical protein
MDFGREKSFKNVKISTIMYINILILRVFYTSLKQYFIYIVAISCYDFQDELFNFECMVVGFTTTHAISAYHH